MAVQTSTTGQLENAAKEMIATARFSAEHSTPSMELIEHFKLATGHDTLVVPKVGRITLDTLAEGQDIVTEKDIGMTTISVSPGEVGGKVIITDKLLRQNSQDIWRIIGRQLGDGQSRRYEEDIVALFPALNGGTEFGTAGSAFSAQNAGRAISIAKTNRMGNNLRVVHHPNAIFRLGTDLRVIGSGTIAAIPKGFSEDRLANYWTGIKIGGVPFFETGIITRDANDDAEGAIFDKGALGILTQLEPTRERQRDASLRAWELVIVSDFVAFEIDDTMGRGLLFDAVDPAVV